MGHLTLVSKCLSAVGKKRILQFFDLALEPCSRVIALVDSTCVFLLLSFYIVISWNMPLFNPLTPGTFCQNCFFFDILVVLKLDRGQISFSLLENSLVARQLAVLATGIAFKTFWPRHAQK